MVKLRRISMMAAAVIAGLFAASLDSFAQGGLPNPYRPVQGLADGGGPYVLGGGWAKLPGGRQMGPPASVDIDNDGESLWALIRCDETSPVPLAQGGRFGIDCLTADNKIKDIDTIYKFNAKGERRQKLRPRKVHLAARPAYRPRGQCVGDRRRERSSRRASRKRRREGRASGVQVQS